MNRKNIILAILGIIFILTQTTLSRRRDSDSDDDDTEREQLSNADGEHFTRETFFNEYDTEKPEHPEVQMAKKYFPNRQTSIDKERYKTLLKMYMDGTVHDEEIDEDIREEAHQQLEEFVENYIEQVALEKDEFTVEDLFQDFIRGKFHDWLDENHPEEDSDDFGSDL